jgi:protoheme IX farnesyltransferase
MNEPATPPALPRSAVLSLAGPHAAVSRRAADFLALTKPRLNLLVVATTLAGYYLGAERFDPGLLANTVAGTALVAGGAAALNEVLERRTDGLMRRTRNRPLPGGRLRVSTATWFALALSAAGLAELALWANGLAAIVAAATLVCYALVYTPLKSRTSLATLVGGVPGGLPPMIGWAAARGTLSLEAWVLFAIVFLWQMPHFLAIAWMCREDYARAGLPMLPVVEPDGRSTAQQVVLYASVLVPVSLLPTLLGVAGRTYFAGALALGAGFLVLGLQFARRRSNVSARRLFLGSISYLPLLWALMLANHGG